MAAPDAAWKHGFEVAGNDQGQGPDFYGKTPAVIIGEATAAYTPAELVTITADLGTFVFNIFSITVLMTGRSNHLFEYDVSTPGLLSSVISRLNFSHRVGIINQKHQIRMYVYDFAAVAWEQLDASIGSAEPRLLFGSANGPNFADYVSGGKLYILAWDYEGMVRTGGGCLHADTLVHTVDHGRVRARDVKLGMLAQGWKDGTLVPRAIEWIADEWPRPRDMVRVTAASYGDVTVTHNHQMPTQLGLVRAGDLVAGTHQLQGLDGAWRAVGMAEHFEESAHVYDIWTPGPSVLVNDGLAVGVMERE